MRYTQFLISEGPGTGDWSAHEIHPAPGFRGPGHRGLVSTQDTLHLFQTCFKGLRLSRCGPALCAILQGGATVHLCRISATLRLCPLGVSSTSSSGKQKCHQTVTSPLGAEPQLRATCTAQDGNSQVTGLGAGWAITGVPDSMPSGHCTSYGVLEGRSGASYGLARGTRHAKGGPGSTNTQGYNPCWFEKLL